MDHEPPTSSGHSEHNPSPPPSLLNPIVPTDPTAPPTLIRPASKDENVREQMLKTPYDGSNHWPSRQPERVETLDEMDEDPPPSPGAFSRWGLPILLFGLTVFTTL
ncbi:MAG TPA: hypothetical protein DD706_23470, partial [Nitrospiraceae bacterium]|nr:hypothetical protein [Nitrospiraceae bacterium]